MVNLTDWLIYIEGLAGKLYNGAHLYFKDNEPLRKFLKHSADDEVFHYNIVVKARKYIREHGLEGGAISIDDETKTRIEAPFIENLEKLERGVLTEESLLDCIVKTEFSEWNDIFLYVLNSLKMKNPEFKSAAAMIQHHLRHIEHFLESYDKSTELAEKIKELPPLWNEKILVVDDDTLITELMRSILRHEGKVDIAHDGAEALELLDRTYYKLIISDVMMPEMDGLEFYRRASERFENLHRRFVFLTGNLTGEIQAYFDKNGLRYMTKPASVKSIREMALLILHQISKTN